MDKEVVVFEKKLNEKKLKERKSFRSFKVKVFIEDYVNVVF